MGYFDWPRCFLIGALQAWFLVDGVVADRDMQLVHGYVTQPELRAPKWNVTIYDQESLSPGYIFVAPYERIGQTEAGDGWIGPHIYDQDGSLIWSGAHLFGNMSVQDFRVSRVLGQDRMSLIKPELRAGVLLDEHFDVAEEIPIEGFNMHDFNFIDDGKRALVITRGVMNSSREDAISTGLEEGLCIANFHGIAEYDVATWKPTWQWSSKDHIWLNESTMANGLPERRCSHGEWDYMHANAVDQCPDGDILLSGRHTDAIYKISKETGDIVWRLGGLANDFEMIDGLNFSRQHDVRCRSQDETTTIITILDNAKGEDPRTPTNEMSRGLRIALNTETMQATLLQHFDHPSGPGSYSFRRGTYQQLPNEHVIMGWSEHSHLSEHSPDGTMLMQMIMQPEWVGTYRSYKFDFVGRPLNPPDVVAWALDGSENTTHTVVYVSWNGATEVATWRLSKSAADGAGALAVASAARAGFETTLVYNGYAKYVFVEALDANGEVIGISRLVTSAPPSNLQSESVVKEQLWLQHVAEEANNAKPDSADSPDKSDTAFDLDVQNAAAFASGVIAAVILAAIGFMVWYFVRRNGSVGWTTMKLPWQQHHVYQPVGTNSKASSMTIISEC